MNSVSNILLLTLVLLLAGCSRSSSHPPSFEDITAGPAGTQAAIPPDDRVILDRTMRDILQASDLSSSRFFYGGPGEHTVALSRGFPAGYVPAIAGFRFVREERDPARNLQLPQHLVVDLRWFRGRASPGVTDAGRRTYAKYDIVACLYCGGRPDGPRPVGGCEVYYRITTGGQATGVNRVLTEDP